MALFFLLNEFSVAFNSKPNSNIIEFNQTNNIKINKVPIEPYNSLYLENSTT